MEQEEQVKEFVLVPRYMPVDGMPTVLGFPANFEIQSSLDGVQWTTFPGLKFSNYPRPSQITGERFTLKQAVQARFIHLVVTRFGTNQFGSKYLQLSEFWIYKNHMMGFPHRREHRDMITRFLLGWFVMIYLLLGLQPEAVAVAKGRLKVADNHRYLQYEDGTPFFYLGDTAWELFHRLNREEALRYLADRAEKGFTVIQASMLAELGGLEVPNPYGDLPLAGRNPAKPNEAYFRQVDFIVNHAEELGLIIGMLPTWGRYWVRGESCIFTPANARQYGTFLGARYKNKPIIWILGGDQTITCDEDRAIIDALAEGLAAGDGGNHLITFHPRGPGLSSLHLHEARWLDFNMSQSSHAARDHDNGLFAEHDYALLPPKPTVDGEPRYEQIPVGFYLRGKGDIDRFDAADVRQAAWWSLLAGACGHTYGNNNIWQMWQPGREPIISANIPWYQALDHPGAFQMGYLKRFFLTLPFQKLVPDQHIILNGPVTGGAKVRAARASDGSFLIVYSPFGESFTLDKSILKAERVQEVWFDPRYGASYPIHETDCWGIQTYSPPSSGRGNDWVLLIKDAALHK